ncbi:MAG: hypothetical protein U0800_15865 [Isosphaeraceae bacterium]
MMIFPMIRDVADAKGPSNVRRRDETAWGRGPSGNDLEIGRILEWAHAHRESHGRWPNVNSGEVTQAPGETWGEIDQALQRGGRGLPGGSSLETLLAGQYHEAVARWEGSHWPTQARPAKRPPNSRRTERPNLSIALILQWADDFHTKTGQWPTAQSRGEHLPPAENWCGINTALKLGRRGLPGGTSLACLLQDERGVRNKQRLPRLAIAQILEWADAHFAQTGRWPSYHSQNEGLPAGETWKAINSALGQGLRGLEARSSLAMLLQENRGVRNKQGLPRLTTDQILGWADAHFARTGRWPTPQSGPILGAETPGETWARIQDAMARGLRGLPADRSLTRLLAEERGVRPMLTIDRILEWADAHREATGRWPSDRSGRVIGAYDENWGAIEGDLRVGRRGLPGGWTLVRLLARFRGRVPGGSETSFGRPRGNLHKYRRIRNETPVESRPILMLPAPGRGTMQGPSSPEEPRHVELGIAG